MSPQEPVSPGRLSDSPPAQPTGGSYMVIASQEFVFIPGQVRVLVRRDDLERIENRIKGELESRNDFMQNLYLALFGGSLGLASALPALMGTALTPRWVPTLYTTASICLFSVGLVLAALDQILRKVRKRSEQSIAQEVHALSGSACQIGPVNPADFEAHEHVASRMPSPDAAASSGSGGEGLTNPISVRWSVCSCDSSAARRRRVIAVEGCDAGVDRTLGST